MHLHLANGVGQPESHSGMGVSVDPGEERCCHQIDGLVAVRELLMPFPHPTPPTPKRKCQENTLSGQWLPSQKPHYNREPGTAARTRTHVSGRRKGPAKFSVTSDGDQSGPFTWDPEPGCFL